MEILLGLVLLAQLFNTLLLIGVAGTLAKLISFLRQEEDEAMPSHERRVLVHSRQPTYADDFMRGPAEVEQARHWDGIPRGPNWDGLPQPRE